MSCIDCGSGRDYPENLCPTCTNHRADNHKPRMTFHYSLTGTRRYPDGYCHGHGPNGREGGAIAPAAVKYGELADPSDLLSDDELRDYHRLIARLSNSQ